LCPPSRTGSLRRKKGVEHNLGRFSVRKLSTTGATILSVRGVEETRKRIFNCTGEGKNCSQKSKRKPS